MMTAQGEVVSCAEGIVTVRCQQKSSCNTCASKSQCGTGMVNAALPARTLELNVPSTQDYETGDLVLIGFPENTVLRFASAVYLIPLLMMISGALLAEIFALTEGVVIFSSLTGLLLGIWLAKFLTEKMGTNPKATPVILKTINATTEDSD